MSSKQDTEQTLEQAIEAVRSDTPSDEAVAQAADRVWRQLGDAKVAGETLQSCADFQALIPAYHAGELAEARRLLVADHIRSCVTCRKALNEKARAAQAAAARAATPHATPFWKWAGVAAGVLLVFVVAQMGLFTGFFVQPAYAQIETASGPVYRMLNDGAVPIGPDARIEAGERVRTAKGVTAELRLSDGSLVEMDERTEFSLSTSLAGDTIDLRRGNIIVSASDQGSGQLFVDTDELEVAVQGTVFSVGHGMKGSRVAVLEGEVVVNQAGQEREVQAGGQYSSRPRLASVEIEQEIDWSPNREQHLALIAEMTALQKDVVGLLNGSQLRTESRLRALVPADTVVYGAMPNISGEMQQVFSDFRDRIASNPSLTDWYAANVGVEGEVMLQLALDRMRAYGEQLGEEIVVALVKREGGTGDAPLILAETSDEQAFLDAVANDIGFIRTLSDQEIPIHLVGSAAEATGDGLFILVNSGLVVISDSPGLLGEVMGNAAAGSAFEGTRFSTTVENAYAQGVNWLLAINLEALADLQPDVERNAALAVLGVHEIHDLVFERKQVAGVTDNRAVIAFSQIDEGLLSWVAEPGPMGGLDFVSPDAQLAAAFVVKEPAQLVDKLFGFVQTTDETAWNELLAAQTEVGLDFRNDLAAPMGGEVVIAVDGPVLPEPSWKVVAEVLDGSTLQSSLETVIEQYNLRRNETDPEVTLSQDGSGHWVLQVGELGPSIEYRFVDGYLIAGANREVIDRAVQFRQTGYTLSTSATFIDLLPQGGATNLSALFYNNVGELLGPLASQVGSWAGEQLTADQQAALNEIVNGMPPTMLSMFAEPGRVTVASTGDLESLWFNLGTLSNLGAARDLTGALEAVGN